ncbi:MAG: GC-type dockerin domain-anchored protein [Phycisphaerales bacterium]|jgi:hypothetical protein
MFRSQAATSLFATLAVAALAHAQPVFPDVLEFEVESSASVTIDTLPTPLSDAAMAFDDDPVSPEAEALAEIERDPFGHQGASCEVVTDGWAPGSTRIALGTSLRFDLGEWRPASSPRERTARGSWSHRLVFQIDRTARVDLSIRPTLFDDVAFFDYEPGRLTGPDGVIVSGVPAPGVSSWIWLLTLEPGQYTFESFGAFEAMIDSRDGLSDRAGMDIAFMSFFAPPCRPDLDGDGELTIFDFLAFQNLFDAGDLEADFDDDGELTLFDFLAFQNAFAAGCP